MQPDPLPMIDPEKVERHAHGGVLKNQLMPAVRAAIAAALSRLAKRKNPDAS